VYRLNHETTKFSLQGGQVVRVLDSGRVASSWVQTRPKAMDFWRSWNSEAQLPSDRKESCRLQVVRFYGMLKIPTEYEGDSASVKFNSISRQVSACFCTWCLLIANIELWWMNQEWLELRWGNTNDQKMVTVHGTPCEIPLSYSISKHSHIKLLL
jgi:hypothetical protein